MEDIKCIVRIKQNGKHHDIECESDDEALQLAADYMNNSNAKIQICRADQKFLLND